jgi:monosaccharide-transporting ATPase
VRLSNRIVVMKDHRKVGEIVVGPEVTTQAIVDVIASDGAPPESQDEDQGQDAEART